MGRPSLAAWGLLCMLLLTLLAASMTMWGGVPLQDLAWAGGSGDGFAHVDGPVAARDTDITPPEPALPPFPGRLPGPVTAARTSQCVRIMNNRPNDDGSRVTPSPVRGPPSPSSVPDWKPPVPQTLADGRLPGQGIPGGDGRFKVVSFALFLMTDGIGVPAAPFTAGVIHNLRMKMQVYPEWQMRLYIGENVARSYRKVMEDLGVTVVVKPFSADRWMRGMFWRFDVSDDPTVERFIVRDLDSRLTLRERKSVDEWIADGTALHSMHDYLPGHGRPLMGGMWGGVQDLLQYSRVSKYRGMSMGDLQAEYHGRQAKKGEDQDFLANQLLPLVAHNMSGGCFQWPDKFCCSDDVRTCHVMPEASRCPERHCSAPLTNGCFSNQTCGYFVGADFKSGLVPHLSATFDCTDPIGPDQMVCRYVEIDYRKQYEAMAGKPYPRELESELEA